MPPKIKIKFVNMHTILLFLHKIKSKMKKYAYIFKEFENIGNSNIKRLQDCEKMCKINY